MHYILESVFVGVYSTLVYFVFSRFSIFQVQLFVTGFFKHFLGFFIGLHSYYCNIGHACSRTEEKQKEKENERKRANMSKKMLITQSIIEGFLFILLGCTLSLFIKHKYVVIFLTGFILHLVFEFLKIHKLFCECYCI